MSQPKDIARYPESYLELASQFEADPRPKRITFSSQREAMRERFKLYGFKDAMRLQPELVATFPIFLSTQIALENCDLVVRRPDDAPGIDAIRAALAADALVNPSPAKDLMKLEQGLLGMKPGYDGSPAENEILKFLDSPSEARLDERLKDSGDTKA
jgi:hypothetical protein